MAGCLLVHRGQDSTLVLPLVLSLITSSYPTYASWPVLAASDFTAQTLSGRKDLSLFESK